MLLFLALTLALVAATNAYEPFYSTVAEWKSSKDSDKYDIVKDYVHYKLYFERKGNALDATCQPENESQLSNRTAALFAAAIDTCPMKKYSPRILANTQVSFKRHVQDNAKELPQTQSDSTLNEFEGNQTGADAPGMDNNENDVVHEYLAIALVLPHHPFSKALIETIRIVSPMYPSVTVYFAIATEFESLCNQYGVRSFPNLLLFHKGLLVDKHKNVNNEKYRPAKLAKRFARWTNSLPRSDPVSNLPQNSYDYSNKNIFLIELQNMTALVKTVLDWSSSVELPWASLWNTFDNETEIVDAYNFNFGASIEPLVSISDDPQTIDIPVYLLSAMYVLGRFLCFVYSHIYCDEAAN